jgi:endoglucanase
MNCRLPTCRPPKPDRQPPVPSSFRSWFASGLSLLLIAGSALAGEPADVRGGVVQRYGQLQVRQGQLCSQAGAPVQLRGMSSHDLKQFPLSSNTVSHLAKDWRVSVIRAAMYTDSYGSSYIRELGVKQTVKQIVEAAVRNDIYVIVDWHILEDGNPNRYRQQAKEFFQEMAATYGRHPHVIYEICNEPNGPGVTWKEIKAYAEFIIPAIRAVDPDSVIIVGTDNWCQGLRAAANDPLPFTNVLYALHFYAGTHGADLRGAADFALAKGLAVFVSEWGLTDHTGKGALYPREAEQWLQWMDQHHLGWANWSLSNANESSAALKPTASLAGPWPDTELSPSGKWVKSRIRSN